MTELMTRWCRNEDYCLYLSRCSVRVAICGERREEEDDEQRQMEEEESIT
jgi:hypothetical protein